MASVIASALKPGTKIFPRILLKNSSLTPIKNYMYEHMSELDDFNINKDPRETALVCTLASDFGKFDDNDVNKLSENSLLALEYLKDQMKNELSVSSYNSALSLLKRCPSLSEVADLQNNKVKNLQNTYFSSEGKARPEDEEKVRTFLKEAIDDDDIYDSLCLEMFIPKLTSILVQASNIPVWRSVTDTIHDEKRVMDVSVLCFPDSKRQEVRLYEFTLTVSRETVVRVGDTESHFHMQLSQARFKPYAALSNSVNPIQAKFTLKAASDVYTIINKGL